MRAFHNRLRPRRLARAALIVAILWATATLALAAVVHVYGGIDHARPSDVIVVLGAGVNRNNSPTRAQRVRSYRAADLWHQGLAPYVICSGGKPGYATISEADTCRNLLTERGVPASAILLEDRSRSTQENGLHTAEIMRARGWQTAIVVSNGYHLLRSNWIFSGVGVVSYTSPVDDSYMSVTAYAYALARDVLALEWLAVVRALNLPFTYVPLV